jgi:hypothetical protein
MKLILNLSFLISGIILTSCASNTASPAVSIKAMAEDIAGPNLPPRETKLSQFKKLTRGMTVPQIFRTVGPPDGDIGTGFSQYTYRLANDIVVIVATPDDETVRYVHYWTEFSTPSCKDHIIFDGTKP